MIDKEEYRYRNLPIPGGGYITSFSFHPKKKNVLYLRTDIGGTYKFNYESKEWESLINHVTMDDLSETFPLAIALDETRPERLYIASGMYNKPNGKMSVSNDYGRSFVHYDMPVRIHGNLPGRGTGDRLIVDKADNKVLWFASSEGGLFKSSDEGASWQRVDSFPYTHLTFVCQVPGVSALIVGCAGVNGSESCEKRGHSLYISYDGAISWQELYVPEVNSDNGYEPSGLVPLRWTYDHKYLYVSFSATGNRHRMPLLAYSCDSGKVIDGTIVRYSIEAGIVGEGEVITPKDEEGSDVLKYGFSGITTVPEHEGWLIASTICRAGDKIYRSKDYGNSWECILYDLLIGKMNFRTEYLTPKYNGNHNLIHWLSDLKCNPFNPDEMWFNTGTGAFVTHNLTDDEVCFSDWSDGIEETVHLNVYAPTGGEVKVVDIVGDLGGFAFKDIDKPCDNSFADAEGNRYITCINADYSENNPNLLIATPRGNWTGMTKGGLIYSENQGDTFRRLDMPRGLSDEIDAAIEEIEKPNVNSGWVALSPNGLNIVWTMCRYFLLPVSLAVVSKDGGNSFKRVQVYDRNGILKTEGGFKAFSDRIDSDIFYGFGSRADFYVSLDGGETFNEVIPTIEGDGQLLRKLTAVEYNELKDNFRFKFSNNLSHEDRVLYCDFSLVDGANQAEIRGVSGKSGQFYMAIKEFGLWRMDYVKASNELRLKRLSNEQDRFYALGLGLAAPGEDYITGRKAIYIAAEINGEYGFYRTIDEGRNYAKLNNSNQMFGQVGSIDGDKRVYGRFYIATRSRGLLYGDTIN